MNRYSLRRGLSFSGSFLPVISASSKVRHGPRQDSIMLTLCFSGWPARGLTGSPGALQLLVTQISAFIIALLGF